MLIHEMILVAVLSPAPLTRPPEAAISRSDLRARTSAMIAGITGQTTHETMASTRPTTALVDVVGAGG